MIMNSQLVMLSKDLMQAIHDSQIYIAIFFICMLLTATASRWWRLRKIQRMMSCRSFTPTSVAEEYKILESSSSASASASSKYQVFLSFRGPDTRQGFTDTLFESLKDAGIRVFRDNNELRVGHEIGKDLMQAIHHSQIYIPIFSKNYAKSKWCLRELAEMVKESRNSKDDKEIIPIFYDVTTDDVKGRKGLFGKAVHALKQDRETVQQWKEALREVCTIKGWELKDQGHAKFCKSVVKEIVIKLRVKHKQVTDCLVGMDGQVKALTDLLDVESDGVRSVGIHGMGGIGKTTLAKVVFNRLSPSFDACSFISDVRETSDSKGLIYLQKQLLKDLGGSVEIDDEDDGVSGIKAVCRTKKVLIVLDDVSQRKHIEKLAGASGWFGARSRIIITTRDKQNFEIKGQEVKPFEKEHLDGEQALELFSLHAFGEKVPPEDYLTLSKEVISFTGGLPLAMEIIGSLLYGHDEKFWRNKIEELKVIPPEDVQKKLMISYESLDSWEKEIFLDIACFFDGEETTYPIYMWDACGFFPKTKVDVLVDRSLIKIKDSIFWKADQAKDLGRDSTFWMHDQVKDLGRKIVRAENLESPEERSRIWEEKEALKILKHLKKGRGKIKAIRLQHVPFSEEGHTFTREELGGLENLRFLQLPECTRIVGDVQDCLPKLRWFSVRECRSVMKATNFSMNDLVILELTKSDVSECWEGWNQFKGMETLKILDLTGSKSLRKTPDLSCCKGLEKLILNSCTNLIELDPSIGNIKSLKYLDCEGCDAFRGFPEEISSMEELECIIVRGSRLQHFNLPEAIGSLKSLKILRLDCLPISKLPQSIGDLTSLVELSLNYTHITELPNSIGGLVNLERLALRCTRVTELPDSIGNLKSLRVLYIRDTRIRELPDCIGNLKSLETLNMVRCDQIRKLPGSIGKLKQLKEILARRSGLCDISIEIGGLPCLRELNFCKTRIRGLPSEISYLPCLRQLELRSCHELQQLPQLPSSLEELFIFSHSLKELPDLSNCTNLIHVWLAVKQLECSNMDWIRRCSKLQYLSLGISKFVALSSELLSDSTAINGQSSIESSAPSSSSKLQEIKCFTMNCCQIGDDEFQLLLEEMKLVNFKSLVIASCRALERLCNLPKLVHLEKLRIFQCKNLKEIEGLGEFTALKALEISWCDSLKRVSGLSNLGRLEELDISECKNLKEVEGWGELESLKRLEISSCDSLKRVSGLSKLGHLEELNIYRCENLKEVEGWGEFASLKRLRIKHCDSLKRLTDLSKLGHLEELYIYP